MPNTVTLEHRVQDAIGKQAWLILTLQQQVSDRDATIAALRSEIEALKVQPCKPEGGA